MATNHTLLCIHQDPGQLSLLKEHGYNLVSATNAPDGLRLFRSRPVDGVVIEHHPRLLDGCALAAEIKNARPQLPVVMLTDHLELPDRALASVDALVTKSDGAHFLLAAVHFVLSVKPASRHAEKLPSRTSVRPSGTSRQKTKRRRAAIAQFPADG
ncbi:MAG: response regulator [Terriglobales bacterium]